MTSLGVKADLDLQAALITHANQCYVYEAGQRVFSEGKKCVGVFLVLSGRVRSFLSSGRDSPMLERLATAGCLLGLPSTVTGEPYSLSAEATGRAELIHVSRAGLTKLMQTDTASAIKLLGLLSSEVRTAPNGNGADQYPANSSANKGAAK